MNAVSNLIQFPGGYQKSGIETQVMNCHTHGQYESKQAIRGYWSGCPACTQASITEESALQFNKLRTDSKSSYERKRTAFAIESAGVPKRFRDRRVGNYKAENEGQRFAKSFSIDFVREFENEHSGRSVVFHGNSGTGKNHLACAIANAVIEQYKKSAHVTTASAMLRSITEAKRHDSKTTASEVINALVSFDLLVIDEARHIGDTSAVERDFFEVFNTRYAEMKPTIFICNGTLANFEQAVGGLFISRLKESNGKPWSVEFSWEDSRA